MGGEDRFLHHSGQRLTGISPSSGSLKAAYGPSVGILPSYEPPQAGKNRFGGRWSRLGISVLRDIIVRVGRMASRASLIFFLLESVASCSFLRMRHGLTVILSNESVAKRINGKISVYVASGKIGYHGM